MKDGEFDKILSEFFIFYYWSSKVKPLSYELVVFNFPEDGYQEPMAKIFYTDSNDFSVVGLRDAFLMAFKKFLAMESSSLEKFKKMRAIQRKYRFIARRG